METLQRSDFLYQAFYCEENIWQLCQHDRFTDSHVMFIASKGEAFPMLYQRAMPDPTTPILWDYHVVLLVSGETHQILDFDTTLPFCHPLDEYLQLSLLDSRRLTPEYIPYFRIIPAKEYTAHFYSDRSHMKTAAGWNVPPPDWPVIGKGSSNLAQYIDMNDAEIGDIYTQQALLAHFS